MAEIYQDIDIFGSEYYSGAPKEYFDKEAIKNAITLWLMMSKREYLYDPDLGGVLNTDTFKNLTSESSDKLQFTLETEFKIYFGDMVDLKEIKITPNYTQRFVEVSVTYADLVNGGEDNINIYPVQGNKQVEVSYEEVALEEESLYNYVRIQKVNMQGQKLVYNTRENCWVWGNKLKLINLDFSDAYFEKILEYINVL